MIPRSMPIAGVLQIMVERVCPACRCIRSCAPVLSREDAIAFGAICGLVEATERKATVADLCPDHLHKLGLLRSIGAFDHGLERDLVVPEAEEDHERSQRARAPWRSRLR